MERPPEPNAFPLDRDAALRELAGIENYIRSTGAVDMEGAALEAIRSFLLSGGSPEEAVRRARELRDSRQDYH